MICRFVCGTLSVSTFSSAPELSRRTHSKPTKPLPKDLRSTGCKLQTAQNMSHIKKTQPK